MAAETDRLSRLVGDLLDLAKLDANRFTLVREEVDLGRLLDQAYQSFAEEAKGRGIRYERRLDGAPTIETDGDRVLQIVSNLLLNAFEWTPDGGEVSRWCSKMATGTGKTVIMSMLIAWQVLNKVANRQDARFSKSILIVAPGAPSWVRAVPAALSPTTVIPSQGLGAGSRASGDPRPAATRRLARQCRPGAPLR